MTAPSPRKTQPVAAQGDVSDLLQILVCHKTLTCENGREVELRVSTMPTAFGEKAPAIGQTRDTFTR